MQFGKKVTAAHFDDDSSTWAVSVDENGWELDQYDQLNPLYVIWEEADGRHGGSMRTLPTAGEPRIHAASAVSGALCMCVRTVPR